MYIQKMDADMGDTKTCRDCSEVLPLTSFHKNKNYRDGLSAICRQCKGAQMRNCPGKSESNQRYHEQNKEAINAKKREKYRLKKLEQAAQQ